MPAWFTLRRITAGTWIRTYIAFLVSVLMSFTMECAERQ
jgi:hypothetical protein